MIRYAVIALMTAVLAVGAAQAFSSLEQGQQRSAAAAMVAEVSPASEAPGQPASITKSGDGHYWAEADVDGHQVRFLVDTGATTVALTAEDARRLGFRPADLAYDYKIKTANGEARVASVKLASVAVAGARVADVDAVIVEQGLESSLLGMTYLGRLSRFEATPTALILRP
jgi:aspartyl protease family protein